MAHATLLRRLTLSNATVVIVFVALKVTNVKKYDSHVLFCEAEKRPLCGGRGGVGKRFIEANFMKCFQKV